MSTPQPATAPAPLFTVHATGIAARPVAPDAAELALYNAGAVASARVTKAELQNLAQTLGQLAESLTDSPGELVTPAGAGRLVVPGRDS